MHPPPAKIKKLHTHILTWYRRHRRELQWRFTDDPYEILVSEIMLQQTQVQRVQMKLPFFLKQFSTLKKLARASKREVILAWQGMGYNNRAVRLRNLAVTVCKQHSGKLPSDIEMLMSLPGVGPYTAHALACFAFQKHVPIVDINIRRVFSRIFWNMKSLSSQHSEQEIWRLAKRILPKDAYTWNQALMDLGATICTARKPLCQRCPVKNLCRSRQLEHHLQRQLRIKKTEPMYDNIPHRIWRGKIIQTLREHNMLTMKKLGSIVKPDFRAHEISWLSSLVEKLTSDGLVSFKRGRVTLAHE